MLGVVAHELRTPITTIYAGSRLLQANRLGPDAREELIDALAGESERLRDFVEDLIVLVGAAAPPDAAPQPALIQRILPPILAAEAERIPGVRYRAHVPRDLPPVDADDAAIVRLIRTLVTTAGTLPGTAGVVEVLAAAEASRLVLRVVARRARISDEQIRNLFDPRADVDRGAGGRTRFGLAAASVTAQRLGGSARAQRTVGGLELHLELPLGLSDELRA